MIELDMFIEVIVVYFFLLCIFLKFLIKNRGILILKYLICLVYISWLFMCWNVKKKFLNIFFKVLMENFLDLCIYICRCGFFYL